MNLPVQAQGEHCPSGIVNSHLSGRDHLCAPVNTTRAVTSPSVWRFGLDVGWLCMWMIIIVPYVLLRIPIVVIGTLWRISREDKQIRNLRRYLAGFGLLAATSLQAEPYACVTKIVDGIFYVEWCDVPNDRDIEVQWSNNAIDFLRVSDRDVWNFPDRVMWSTPMASGQLFVRLVVW